MLLPLSPAKKRYILLLIFLSLWMVLQQLCFPVLAYGEDTDAIIDLQGLENFLQDFDRSFSTELEDFHLQSIWQQIKAGDFQIDFSQIGTQLGQIFWGELLQQKTLFMQLILISIAALVLNMIAANFLQGGVASLTRGIVYMALIAITLTSFQSASRTALTAVTNMTDLFYAFMPFMLTILAGIGGVTTVSIVHPLVLAGLTMATFLIRHIIFPFIYFATVLKVVSYISPKFNLEKLSGLGKDIALGLLGITMSVFLGVLGIAGVGSSTLDGLTLKVAKMATGTFVPVIGRSLADALDGILGTSLLLKNGIGLIGVLGIFLLCALPAIKVLVLSIIYRLTGALLQPLGDEKLAAAVSGIGNSLLLVFAVLVATGILFFFTISLLVAMGNITMMMR